MNYLARHVILELSGCEEKRLNSVPFLRDVLLRAATEAGATVVDDSFHTFPPYGGVSGVVIILESHLSIHTWPEHSYAAVDIFTCGTSVRPEKAVDFLLVELQPRDSSVVEMKRGILKTVTAQDGKRMVS